MKWLKSLFTGRSDPPLTELVYIRLPGRIEPLERGDRFEDPLIEALAKVGAGEVTGGGSSLGPEDAEGRRFVEFAGIDIDTYNVDLARSVARSTMTASKAPAGTQVEFTREGAMRMDRLEESGWSLDLPRTDTHPGFGV